MPNNRKSKVERLPKAERRHAASKIVILQPTTGAVYAPSAPPGSRTASAAHQVLGSPALVQPEVPSRQNREEHSPPSAIVANRAERARTRPPRLDDESLAKLLLAAGPPGVVAALGVCMQWRRVAQEILNSVSRVDLGKMYVGERGGRKSPPTYGHVLRTLQHFPKLVTLIVRNWLYQDVMEDVVAHVCANLKCDTLKRVELSGVLVKSSDLAMLMQRCSNVQNVKLENHASVNERLLTGFAVAYKAMGTEEDKGVQTITLSKCQHVNREGVACILKNAAPAVVTITGCDGLRRLEWWSTRSEPMDKLTVTNCNNLKGCYIAIPEGRNGVYDLNLSQCPKLREIVITSAAGGFEHSLRKLSLSGCGSLSDLAVQRNSDTSLFENLEELILFGVNTLSPRYFSGVFGLDKAECMLPKVQRLDLNGCRVQVLKLISYTHLTSIDVSGCPELSELEVRDSWQMKSLSVLGRRAPLQSVILVLPANCVVRGRRTQWHWECYESNQTISFP